MSVASRTIFVHLATMKEEALVQFKLMLPAGLKARVEVSATSNRRSLSQEIVATLEDRYPAPGRVFDEAKAVLAALRQDVKGYAEWSQKPLQERLDTIAAELAARGFVVDDGVKLGIVLDLLSEGLPKISAAEAAERRARSKPKP